MWGIRSGAPSDSSINSPMSCAAPTENSASIFPPITARRMNGPCLSRQPTSSTATAPSSTPTRMSTTATEPILVTSSRSSQGRQRRRNHGQGRSDDWSRPPSDGRHSVDRNAHQRQDPVLHADDHHLHGRLYRVDGAGGLRQGVHGAQGDRSSQRRLLLNCLHLCPLSGYRAGVCSHRQRHSRPDGSEGRFRSARTRSVAMSITLGIFLCILFITLGITYWAARRTRTTSEFYAADSRLTAAQNGFALAGDWCSAAAFLGFSGLTALYGMDGAFYALGPLM